MSVYRLLVDHPFGLAGMVVATADEGGDNAILSVGYVPDGGMEPLNPAAVEDFFNAGPQACPPILPRWVGQAVILNAILREHAPWQAA